MLNLATNGTQIWNSLNCWYFRWLCFQIFYKSLQILDLTHNCQYFQWRPFGFICYQHIKSLGIKLKADNTIQSDGIPNDIKRNSYSCKIIFFFGSPCYHSQIKWLFNFTVRFGNTVSWTDIRILNVSKELFEIKKVIFQ